MKESRSVLVFAIFLAGIVAIVVMALVAPQFFGLDAPLMRVVDQIADSQPPSGTADHQNYFLARIFEDSGAGGRLVIASMVEIVQRLLLAVVLSGILAFRPRKNVPLFRRSLFVSQTQILLAVVAAALMMIVGDNAARAFAIFAAVSLVRFRTNIRDPKEITVLLISMALGLSAGIGRWDLGIALCLFALGLLWLLEMRESEVTVRSMELSVKTRNPDRTQEILKKIFHRLKIDAEVREIEPPDEKSNVGSIAYYLNLPVKLTTDKLSDRILAADPDNIEGIQWSKSKSASDIFQ
jgi:uncharacterized membrane protein YhiD involved in acid resistance